MLLLNLHNQILRGNIIIPRYILTSVRHNTCFDGTYHKLSFTACSESLFIRKMELLKEVSEDFNLTINTNILCGILLYIWCHSMVIPLLHRRALLKIKLKYHIGNASVCIDFRIDDSKCL